MESGLSKKDVTKRLTQRDRVLALLIAGGEQGVTSEELNKISFRYSAVVFDLRATGHDIQTVPRVHTGLVRYVWHRGPQPQTQQELFA